MSSSKERMRRHRERRRAGRRAILIEVDDVSLGAFLEGLDLLDPMLADDDRAFNDAVSELLQAITTAWEEDV